MIDLRERVQSLVQTGVLVEEGETRSIASLSFSCLPQEVQGNPTIKMKSWFFLFFGAGVGRRARTGKANDQGQHLVLSL